MKEISKGDVYGWPQNAYERRNKSAMTVDLPIRSLIPEIVKALAVHGKAIVEAEPGAGKTTFVPIALLGQPFLANKQILILEPRRLATRMAACRMAELLNETVGETVGYQIRNERVMGPGTRIIVMTEGIFTRKIQSDPELQGVGLVIFDEFHERNIHTDLGLALSLEAAEVFRDDLKLMVMSATMETEAVSHLMADAPFIRSKGVNHPVETIYAKRTRTNRSGRFGEKECAAQVVRALNRHEGDILVFLPGAGEIREVNTLLAAMITDKSVSLFPLYGNLSKEEQDTAIRPSKPGARKVVLATAIAETSLTIQGITVVIDSGFMRAPRYYPGQAMGRLETLPVSKSSADQRRGRAGRLGPGLCYRMWTEEEHALHPDFNTPEILQTDLTALALEIGLWGGDPDELRWLDPPPKGAFEQAKTVLAVIGAFDPEGRVTGHGRELAGFGVHPRLGHMLVTARGKGMGSLACLIAAYLGERDFFLDQEERRLSDIRSRLSVLLDLRTGKLSDARNLSINRSIVSTILKNAKKLEKELGLKPTGTGLSVNDAGTVLAFAYPERIAMAVKNGHGSYKMASGNATFLLPGDPLSLEPMIVCAELDGNRTRSRIFIAAPYSVESLKADFGHDVKKMDVLEWDEKSQAVTAETRQGYGQLVLATEPLGKPDQEAVTDILVSRIMAAGLDVLPWNPALRTLRSRAVFLKSVEGFDDFPDLSDGALSERLDRWLRPYLTGIRSFAKLRNIDLHSAVMSLLTWNHRNRLDELAPTHLIVPSGSRIPLDYMVVEDRLHTSPVLSVRLQEMFGCMETPRIVKGRIPVTVQLLSPAGRIMQVTKDLESFWKNTYEQVKKDLKGRYPKHYWPDDPFAAIATNKTKKSMDRKS